MEFTMKNIIQCPRIMKFLKTRDMCKKSFRGMKRWKRCSTYFWWTGSDQCFEFKFQVCWHWTPDDMHRCTLFISYEMTSHVSEYWGRKQSFRYYLYFLTGIFESYTFSGLSILVLLLKSLNCYHNTCRVYSSFILS